MRNILAYSSIFNILDLSTMKIYLCDNGLKELEQYSTVSVNGIIASDRILSKMKKIEAFSYLCCLFKYINDYLVNNEVEMVFGEATWAHEMVTAAVCKKLEIPYLAPVNVRYPSSRFAFFEGVTQSHIYTNTSKIDLVSGVKLHDNFLMSNPSPFYMTKRSKGIVKPLIKHLRRHLTRDTRDKTVPSIYRLISNEISKKFPKNQQNPKPSGDYYYLPLQCQPESSIDILAGYYRNQREFVSNVSRSLPYGAKLVVKEHPLSAKGENYDDIPSVLTVASTEDGFELIRNSKCVITISGTVAYEAGLLGVPAVIFTDLFFNELPTIKRCSSMEKLSETIEDIMNTKADKASVIAFLAKLFSMSYEGYCESVDVYPDALDEENIRMVTYAFMDVIDSYSSTKSATAASMCSKLI